MRMIKEVLRLHHSCGFSHKKISTILGCSHGAVAEYIHRAKAAGFTWPVPSELDDEQLNQRLFPRPTKSRGKPLPDCNYLHSELKKKGVTLVQLWSEYREQNPDGYGLTQFCDIYGAFKKKLNLVMPPRA